MFLVGQSRYRWQNRSSTFSLHPLSPIIIKEKIVKPLFILVILACYFRNAELSIKLCGFFFFLEKSDKNALTNKFVQRLPKF